MKRILGLLITLMSVGLVGCGGSDGGGTGANPNPYGGISANGVITIAQALQQYSNTQLRSVSTGETLFISISTISAFGNGFGNGYGNGGGYGSSYGGVQYGQVPYQQTQYPQTQYGYQQPYQSAPYAGYSTTGYGVQQPTVVGNFQIAGPQGQANGSLVFFPDGTNGVTNASSFLYLNANGAVISKITPSNPNCIDMIFPVGAPTRTFCR